MPEGVRRQVIPGDGKCLYSALSAVYGAGGAGSSRRGAQSAHGGGDGAAPRVGLGAESYEGRGSAHVGSVLGQSAQGRDMGRGM